MEPWRNDVIRDQHGEHVAMEIEIEGNVTRGQRDSSFWLWCGCGCGL